MKTLPLPRAVRCASRRPAESLLLLTGLLLAALTLAGAGSTHASPAADAPRGGSAASPQTLFLPCTMKRPPDMSGPEVNVALIINSQQVTAPNNVFSAPHLHGTPSGYYRLKMAATDASGVYKLGWDINGDGVIDISNEVYLLDPANFGTASYQAVAMDSYGNYTRVPVTLDLTNQAPAAPQPAKGSTVIELGTRGEVGFTCLEPNSDQLVFEFAGDIPAGAHSGTRSGYITLPEATFENFISPSNPYHLQVIAWELDHGHGTPLASSPLSFTMSVVDTIAPDTPLPLAIDSNAPEKLGISLNIPNDNGGQGRVRDVSIAVAPHPIADWHQSDVRVHSLRQCLGITDPNQYFIPGDPHSITVTLGLGDGRKTWYADAYAIDAAGNQGRPLGTSSSTYVESLGEYLVRAHINPGYKTLICLDNRPAGHSFGDTGNFEGKWFVRQDMRGLAQLLNPSNPSAAQQFLNDISDGDPGNYELWSNPDDPHPSVEFNYNLLDLGYVAFGLQGPKGYVHVDARDLNWAIMDQVRIILSSALVKVIDDPASRPLYTVGVSPFW